MGEIVKSKLTYERLVERLDYNPEDGLFTWKPRSVNSKMDKTWNKTFSGRVAGCIENSGCGNKYIIIGIDRSIYRGHRLAWLYMTKRWPKEDIDHINRNGMDNRFENLREATQAQNLGNTIKHIDNKSGFKGVFWSSQKRKWQAVIQVRKKRIHLGFHSSPEEAAARYAVASVEHYKEFSRTV